MTCQEFKTRSVTKKPAERQKLDISYMYNLDNKLQLHSAEEIRCVFDDI